MNAQQRKILVTSALPYANAPLHLGYILEAIQTDVWVRHQKAQGHMVHYVCGDDAHGASIMLKAAEQGITEEEHCATIFQSHKQDLDEFLINIDHYHTTHSEENRIKSEAIFRALESKGLILKQEKQQLFDPMKAMFLADRFVKGQCPKCNSPDQYGDNCEVCSSTYEPTDLINPVSVFTGATPELKSVEQLYFNLPSQTDFLNEWLNSKVLPKPVANKLREWLNFGLKPWDISREAPYFGFEIPGYPGKYFYVWLDAPIGYMASFQALCDSPKGQAQGLEFDDYWGQNSDAELHHFIGKDIINFHGLFWPAMLQNAGFRLPTSIQVHGYVTLNGEKMSKSRGTFVTARQYLNHFDPDLLRYYYASKLGPTIDDLDLNLTDFANKINADLVGKVVNIASRCAKFINQFFDSSLCTLSDASQADYNAALALIPSVNQNMDQHELGKACRIIMQIADEANRIIDERKPWVTIKDPEQQAYTHDTCTLGVCLFRVVMTCLTPITPQLSTRSAAFFQVPALTPAQLNLPIDNTTKVALFTPLLKRVDIKTIEKHFINTATNSTPKSNQKKSKETPMNNPDTNISHQDAPETEIANPANLKPEIKIDDFMKLDLRVVTIVDAKAVEGSDKLIQTTVDIGHNVTRTIFAGMKSAYTPESMIGRKVLALVNLKPRKMRFGTSEGMLLGAGPGEKEIFLLSPDEGAVTGMHVS